MKKPLFHQQWYFFLIVFLASIVTAKTNYYEERFSGNVSLRERGLSVVHSKLDSINGLIRTNAPDNGISKITTASFRANRVFDTVTVAWNIRFPTKGKSRHQHNKVGMSLVGAKGKPLYEVTFEPNSGKGKKKNYDLELLR